MSTRPTGSRRTGWRDVRLPRVGVDALLVWATWAAAAGFSGWCFLAFARPVPLTDEYLLIPQAVGAAPVTSAWLWEDFFQQRMPVPKLIQLGLLWLTHGFLAARVLNLLLLMGSAAALLVTCRRLRGRWSAVDGAVALLVLSPVQAEVFLIGFALNLVLSAALMAIIVMLIAEPRPASRSRTILLMTAVVALPLCGMTGVVFVPPLLPWLAWSGVREWNGRSPSGRRHALCLWAGCLTAAVVIGCYLHGLHRPATTPPLTLAGVCRLARMHGCALSLSAGVVEREGWPVVALAVTAWLLTAVGRLIWLAVSSEPDRHRALGLLSFLGACVVLLAGLAWGRGDAPEGGIFMSRYVTLAVPLLAGVYLATLAAGGPSLSRILPILFLGFQLITLRGVVDESLSRWRYVRAISVAMEQRLRGRVPIPVVAEIHLQSFYYNPAFGESLRLLRDAGWKPCRGAAADQLLDQLSIPWSLTQGRRLSGLAGPVTPATGMPGVPVPVPCGAAGVGLRVHYHSDGWDEGNALAVLAPGTDRAPEVIELSPAPGDHTAVVWALPGRGGLALRLTHPTRNFHLDRLTAIVPRGPAP